MLHLTLYLYYIYIEIHTFTHAHTHMNTYTAKRIFAACAISDVCSCRLQSPRWKMLGDILQFSKVTPSCPQVPLLSDNENTYWGYWKKTRCKLIRKISFTVIRVTSPGAWCDTELSRVVLYFRMCLHNDLISALLDAGCWWKTGEQLHKI